MEATAGGDGPLIVLMGSGETTPTMAGVDRDVVARARPARAVVLDTPYGFQENAAEISARARDYFARSVGPRVDVPSGLRGSVREWGGSSSARCRTTPPCSASTSTRPPCSTPEPTWCGCAGAAR